MMIRIAMIFNIIPSRACSKADPVKY